MNTPSRLTIRSVGKQFCTKGGAALPVISNLTFDVPSGAIVALLGASGCGKSTLLRIISGEESIGEGEIYSSTQRPGVKLGYMRQSDGLLPWLTVSENIQLGLRLTGQPKLPTIEVEKLLTQVGLYDSQESYPAQLSGGMTQRALLARVLALRSKLMLLDEPFGQLDVLSRQQLSSIVRNYVAESGAGVLLVTHSIEEAISMADRILIISRRPATIKTQFCLNPLFEASGFISTQRSQCFGEIQAALLAALSEEQGEVS